MKLLSLFDRAKEPPLRKFLKGIKYVSCPNRGCVRHKWVRAHAGKPTCQVCGRKLDMKRLPENE